MEINLTPIEPNSELRIASNEKQQYFAETSKINFQTPFQGAELKLSLDSILAQSDKPEDSLVSCTNFYFEDKNLGFSCFEKSLLGKNITIKIAKEVYKGILEEEFTKLIK